ncbi:A24 family peptidase [Polynucleobacter sp. JS-Safj-400b-B2]|uniref:prepilin peptidase n=1 Tax=Polynucleobacter sp. JS-Safj-400b-B2 TaxID=2576921 RepID=UPI001C0C958D|nr:A24 family peptidase [Polynucleobacter sp. JS-Safj-400b-B2]
MTYTNSRSRVTSIIQLFEAFAFLGANRLAKRIAASYPDCKIYPKSPLALTLATLTWVLLIVLSLSMVQASAGMFSGTLQLVYFLEFIRLMLLLGLLFSLLTLALVDWRIHLLPDILTKPLWLLGYLYFYMGQWKSFKISSLGAAFNGQPFSSSRYAVDHLLFWLTWLIAPFMVYGFFWLVGKFGQMGQGDAKLAGVITAWFGGWAFAGYMPSISYQALLLIASFSFLDVWFLRKALAKQHADESAQVEPTSFFTTPFALGPSLIFGVLIYLIDSL